MQPVSSREFGPDEPGRGRGVLDSVRLEDVFDAEIAGEPHGIGGFAISLVVGNESGHRGNRLAGVAVLKTTLPRPDQSEITDPRIRIFLSELIEFLLRLVDSLAFLSAFVVPDEGQGEFITEDGCIQFGLGARPSQFDREGVLRIQALQSVVEVGDGPLVAVDGSRKVGAGTGKLKGPCIAVLDPIRPAELPLGLQSVEAGDLDVGLGSHRVRGIDANEFLERCPSPANQIGPARVLGFPASFFQMNAGQFQRNELEFFRSQQPLLGLQFFQALDSEIDEARCAQCAHEIELRDSVSE